MILVRELTLLILYYNFTLKPPGHIDGIKNNISDALSRFQNLKFRELAPWVNQTPQEIPAHLLAL